MKKLQLLNWILITFLAFQFISYENVILEGVFTDCGIAQEGRVVADIDDINFITRPYIDTDSTTLNAILIIQADGSTQLSVGGFTDSGTALIGVRIANPVIGAFDLTITDLEDLDSYDKSNAFYTDELEIENKKYATLVQDGGSGEINLTKIDTTNQLVSGTFEFIGVRKTFDDTGEEILDENGESIIEIIEVSCGAFKNIHYEIVFPEGDLVSNFFAKVDEEDFIPETLTTIQVTVGDTKMINVIAENENGEILRIDFPQSLGLGTFDMEPISDGTKTIGLYDPNVGGETFTSNPGTLTITKFDTEEGIIEANFDFTATDPLGIEPDIFEITEGSFVLNNLVLIDEINSSFSAEVDNEEFNPTTVTAIEDDFNGIPIIEILATNSETNQSMKLSFPLNIIEGTYDMSPLVITGEEIIGFYTPDVGNTITYTSSIGTLIISNYNTETRTITGSFVFTATDPSQQDPAVFEITNGEFLVDIQ